MITASKNESKDFVFSFFTSKATSENALSWIFQEELANFILQSWVLDWCNNAGLYSVMVLQFLCCLWECHSYSVFARLLAFYFLCLETYDPKAYT